MEYLEGQPLNRVMARRNKGTRAGDPTALAEMLRIVCDALAGIHYAHELTDYDGTPLKVVHRDVSPHNIFVTYDGMAKVVDFGIAKAAVRSAYTSTGVVKGKISYMASEQALSVPIDRRADVFSMGVILWELVAGERLWGNLTEVQILQKMAFGEVPRLKSRRPDAPAELDRICAKAVAMIPAERYATAAELRDDVDAYMKANFLGATPSEVGTLVSTMFKDRRAEVKAVVQEQLRGMKDDGMLSNRDFSIPDITVETESKLAPRGVLKSLPKRPSDPHHDATPSATGVGTHTSEILRPMIRRRRRSTLLAALLGAAVLGIGGLALLKAGVLSSLLGRQLDAGGNEPTPTTLPTEGARATATPAGALIDVRIDASPASAAIYLDDVAVQSNPFSAKFASDGTGHRVRVEAPGYKAQTRMVVYDKDVALSVALDADKSAEGLDGTSVGSDSPGASAHPAASAKAAPPWHKKGTKVDATDPFKDPRR